MTIDSIDTSSQTTGASRLPISDSDDDDDDPFGMNKAPKFNEFSFDKSVRHDL
jgi:hypothetical protein